MLDLHRGDRHDLSVAVFIDERLGGAVKWIRLLGPVPAETRTGSSWDMLGPADLPEVAAHLRAAIEMTDRDPTLTALHEFADLRAFLLARLIDVPDQAERGYRGVV